MFLLMTLSTLLLTATAEQSSQVPCTKIITQMPLHDFYKTRIANLHPFLIRFMKSGVFKRASIAPKTRELLKAYREPFRAGRDEVFRNIGSISIHGSFITRENKLIMTITTLKIIDLEIGDRLETFSKYFTNFIAATLTRIADKILEDPHLNHLEVHVASLQNEKLSKALQKIGYQLAPIELQKEDIQLIYSTPLLKP